MAKRKIMGITYYSDVNDRERLGYILQVDVKDLIINKDER